MKNIWIIANWKSNKSLEEALSWVEQVGSQLPKKENIKVVVCPQFHELPEVRKAIQVGNFPILVGAQNLSPFPEGAYTGEVAAKDIKTFIDLSILGHSERRQNFGETDELIAKKVDQAKEYAILPLVCVQEEDTSVPEGCKVIAYEPVFAIGTGKPDTPENANKVATSLKEKNGQDIEVLYGGSVTSETCTSFVQQENIAGLLIGKASLDAEHFATIVQLCAKL